MSQLNSFYKEMGVLIGQKRVKLGMSQLEMANKLGVNRMTVNRWENGLSVPRKKEIKKICDLLNIDYQYLIYLATERSAQARVDDIQNFVSRETIRIPLYDDMPVDKMFSDVGLTRFISVSSHLLNPKVKYFALTSKRKSLSFNEGDVLLFEHTSEHNDEQFVCAKIKDGLHIVPGYLCDLYKSECVGVLRRALKNY